MKRHRSPSPLDETSSPGAAPPRFTVLEAPAGAGEVHSVAFSPDGLTLAAGCRSGTIVLWEVASAREQATLAGHTGWVFCLAYSPDGETLASAGHDGTVKYWDVSTGWELASF